MRGEHIDLRPGSGSHQHNREEPRRTQETIKVPILSKAPCPSSGFLAVNCPRIESHQTLPPNEMNSAACPSGLKYESQQASATGPLWSPGRGTVEPDERL